MSIHLIIDEQSVIKHEGVSFHLNPAVKHPDNPVLLPGEPHQWDSLQVSWPATVLYDQSEHKFKCWYSGFDCIQSPDRSWKPGYAESEDGIHWTKPNLGQVEFLGSDTNRIEVDWKYTILSCVFENPDVSSDAKYASLWTEMNDEGAYQKGLAYSSDGLHWHRAATPYKGLPNDRPSFQDISQLLYDPDEPNADLRIKGYTQLITDRKYDSRANVRHIGTVTGSEIEKLEDSGSNPALSPEQGIDEELHFATVRKIGGLYVMLYESGNFSRNPIHSDIKLAVSTNGLNFRRTHKTTPVIDTGPKGFWDENLIVTTTSAMQEIDNKLYIFYIGCPGIYNSWPPPYMYGPERRGSMFAPAYMGLAMLPKDRYAYAKGPGSVCIEVETLDELCLNADGNGIEVTACTEPDGTRFKGMLPNQMYSDIYRKVIWETKPPAGRATVEIFLENNCSLYSVKTAD